MQTIPLTKGFEATIDDQDYEEILRFKWCVSLARGIPYALRGPHESLGETKRVYMHRQIMKPPPDMFVDHSDGNTLFNCRSNLRICTRSDNGRNSISRHGASKYKGVSWHNIGVKWQVHIGHQYLGLFDCEVEAAQAYDNAAKIKFGEFANLNFTEGIQ